MNTRLKYPAPGKLVNVNKHKIHIFSEGQGERTLVFMAGSGTSCPTLDFKPLWSLLSDDNRIVVIEKAGYGWSESTKNPRDLNTMLDESREALVLAGIHAPYYLVPHSMSGLEAIHWAQKYPDEVKAIIGLDPGIPDLYDAMKISPIFTFTVGISSLLARLGISESLASAICHKNFPSFQSTFLTDDDRAVYIDIVRNSTFTSNMINERKSLRENTKIAKEQPIPSDIPLYFFISNGKGMDGIGVKSEAWRKLLKNFLTNFDNAKYQELDCGHYVHSYEPIKIADEIKAFVSTIV